MILNSRASLMACSLLSLMSWPGLASNSMPFVRPSGYTDVCAASLGLGLSSVLMISRTALRLHRSDSGLARTVRVRNDCPPLGATTMCSCVWKPNPT